MRHIAVASLPVASWDGVISSQSDPGVGGRESHPAAILCSLHSPHNALAWEIPCWNISHRASCRLWVLMLLFPPPCVAPPHAQDPIYPNGSNCPEACPEWSFPVAKSGWKLVLGKVVKLASKCWCILYWRGPSSIFLDSVIV